MKLSEIPKGCAVCSEPLVVPFYRVRVDMAVPNHQAAREVIGVNAILGGTMASLGIAEALAPNSEVVEFTSDKAPLLAWSAFLCVACLCASRELAPMIEG